MKVYIPFNSNDFNSVFSTLSISPRGFYPLRNYSFKRSHFCVLNPLEFSLLAFASPIFPNKKFDSDEGYTINIEVDLDIDKLVEIPHKKINIYCVKTTLYLFNGFKLIFKTESEANEVFAKSLKSIETKFAELARLHTYISHSFKDTVIVKDDLKLKTNDIFNDTVSFALERKINKVLGATLGYAIGVQNTVGNEFGKLKYLKRELENLTTIFFNSVLSKNENGERQRIISCLDEIFNFYENELPLHHILKENLDASPSLTLDDLKASKLFGFSVIDLIIEGLMAKELPNTPLQLVIQQTKKNIFSSYNNKYPDSYLQKIDECIIAIKRGITELIGKHQQQNSFSIRQMLTFGVASTLYIENFDIEDDREKEYFEVVLDFFCSKDEILNNEVFFSERTNILTHLGRYLKQNLEFFDTSTEKQYLLNLLDSFKNLRTSFNPNNIRYDTFKSLGILFTSGRDLLKYFDNVSYSSIENLKIPMAIWGATYGYSSLPKTFTEDLLKKSKPSELLLGILDQNLRTTIENASKFGLDQKHVKQSPEDISFEIVENINEPIKDLTVTDTLPLELPTNGDVASDNKVKDAELLNQQIKLLEKKMKADHEAIPQPIINLSGKLLIEIYKELSGNKQILSHPFLVKNFESSLKIKKSKGLTNNLIKKIVSYYSDVILETNV